MRPSQPIALAFSVISFAACRPSATASDARRPAIAEEAARVIDGWHAAAARADEQAYFALFAKDGVFLGTDATERWTVPAFRAYAHPHFAKGKAWAFRCVRRAFSFSRDGNVAWFDEDLETNTLGPARGSGVLVREGAFFRIAHYDLSVPIPNARFAEIRNVIATSAKASGATVVNPVDGWPTDFTSALGKEVTLEGTAVNAKLGAMLRAGERSIWIDGRDAWPDGFYLGGDRGKRVRVTGVVIERHDLPVFVPKLDEPIPQGIPLATGADVHKASQRFLLGGATWKVLE
jgi:hypothetical protein